VDKVLKALEGRAGRIWAQRRDGGRS